MTARPRLPKYHRPPVIEAYCGVYFRDLAALTAPRVGAFWQQFRKNFPETQSHPLLPPLFLADQVGTIFVQAVGAELPRTWFVSADEDNLIQLQKDRLFFNWRKISDGTGYPSYRTLRNKFRSILQRFLSFAEKERIEPIQLIGAEMGYTNGFNFGREIDSLCEIGTLLPSLGFKGCDEKILSNMDLINSHFRFKFPDDRGAMFLTLQNLQKPQDGTKMLKMDLYARLVEPNLTSESAMDWLDDAHAVVVTSFSQLTNEKIQKDVWERYQ